MTHDEPSTPNRIQAHSADTGGSYIGLDSIGLALRVHFYLLFAFFSDEPPKTQRLTGFTTAEMLSSCLVDLIPRNVDFGIGQLELSLKMSQETRREYPSYADASKDACKWVNGGKKKIVPDELVLYKGKLGSGNNKIVGIGLKTAAGVDVPYVRLDVDNTNNAIHFNAVQLSDSSKLAAVLRPTIALDQPAREQLYAEYLKGIENRSAKFIWEWWSTGIPPS
ncbi:hypothetical protein MPER_11184 [Moniliophthora perniciosa FA553]|nr:hypothetical protein MPER_11184 [Moniliophthora perniciosa FA553]